jgi:hypothetical protein
MHKDLLLIFGLLSFIMLLVILPGWTRIADQIFLTPGLLLGGLISPPHQKTKGPSVTEIAYWRKCSY